MRGTKRGAEGTADQRRVARWQRDVGPMLLSDAAYELLIRRLAIRRRALQRSVPIGILGLVPLTLTMFDDPASADWGQRNTPNYVAFVLMLASMTVTTKELTHRWEKKLSAAMTTRVSRTTSVGLITVLGPVRITGLAATAAFELILGVMAMWMQIWIGVCYLGVFAASMAFSALGLRRAVNRPTIAVDEVSLAVDERIRAEDAFASAGALFILFFAFPASALLDTGPTHAWFLLLWCGGLLLGFAMQEFGRRQPPWKPGLGWRARFPVAGLRQR